MRKKNFSTTIYIDTETSAIHCVGMTGMDPASAVHKIKNYSGAHFDERFFKTFNDAVSEFVSEKPSNAIGKVSLILPDNAVSLDTVNVPTMRNSAATKKALASNLTELYRNIGALEIQLCVAAQNKQYTTFSVAAVQKRILTSVYSICAENRLLVDTATYASSASVAALSALNPKLKNASYLFLDIKRTYSRFVFAVNGRAAGYYHLPFGLDFLTCPCCIQEDMLFDHSLAELTVLNAKEKAKARRLSVLSAKEDIESTDAISEADPSDDEDHDVTDEENEEPSTFVEFHSPLTTETNTDMPKYTAKKTPRKLPKFMQRPIPKTVEDIAKENFRVYAKWALSLIADNERITSLGAPAFVYVNLPQKFSYVLDAINAEKDGRGIRFRLADAGEADVSVLSELEIYGGFFPKLVHPANKF